MQNKASIHCGSKWLALLSEKLPLVCGQSAGQYATQDATRKTGILWPRALLPSDGVEAISEKDVAIRTRARPLEHSQDHSAFGRQ